MSGWRGRCATGPVRTVPVGRVCASSTIDCARPEAAERGWLWARCPKCLRCLGCCGISRPPVRGCRRTAGTLRGSSGPARTSLPPTCRTTRRRDEGRRRFTAGRACPARRPRRPVDKQDRRTDPGCRANATPRPTAAPTSRAPASGRWHRFAARQLFAGRHDRVDEVAVALFQGPDRLRP